MAAMTECRFSATMNEKTAKKPAFLTLPGKKGLGIAGKAV
jgi:hypothetical protein